MFKGNNFDDLQTLNDMKYFVNYVLKVQSFEINLLVFFCTMYCIHYIQKSI